MACIVRISVSQHCEVHHMDADISDAGNPVVGNDRLV